MPAPSLPNFNVNVNIWTTGQTFPTDVPTYAGIECQVYLYSRLEVDATPGMFDQWTPVVMLRIPKDVLTTTITFCQVLPGVANYYKVRWVHPVHYKFPNEYMAIIAEPCTSGGITIYQRIP